MKKTSKVAIAVLFFPTLAVIAGTDATGNDVRLGKQIFAKATCEACHPGGNNALHPSKPLKGSAFAEKYPDDAAITRVVRSGIANTGMPAFSKMQLSDHDLKLVIAYIRSLSAQNKAKNAKQS